MSTSIDSYPLTAPPHAQAPHDERRRAPAIRRERVAEGIGLDRIELSFTWADIEVDLAYGRG